MVRVAGRGGGDGAQDLLQQLHAHPGRPHHRARVLDVVAVDGDLVDAVLALDAEPRTAAVSAGKLAQEQRVYDTF